MRWLIVLLVAAAGHGALYAQALTPRYPRAFAINQDPWIESRNQLLHQVGGWNHPATLTTAYVGDLATSSHGLLKVRVTTTFMMDDWPIKNDGFRYTDTSYLACLQAGGGWLNHTSTHYYYLESDRGIPSPGV